MVWLYFIEGVVRATGDGGTSARAGRDRGRAVPGAVHRLRGPCAWRTERTTEGRGMTATGSNPNGASASPAPWPACVAKGSCMTLLADLRAAVGDAAVLTDGDLSAWEVDWRKRSRGRALAVVRPGSTDEVAAVVRTCAAHGTPIVPQGGNTGLVGGSMPDASGAQIVLSLTRMNRIRAIDAANLTMTVDAGCVLQTAQEAAAARRPALPAEPRGRRQLHDRRQPRHQRRRHPGAALRQCARAVPRPRGGDRVGRDLGRPQRPAQGQHRLRPARPLHRQRRHARRHHRRDPEAVPAARGGDHRARQRSRRWRRRSRCCSWRRRASAPG